MLLTSLIENDEAEDGSESGCSFATGESSEGPDHHLLTAPNSDMAFLRDTSRLEKELP